MVIWALERLEDVKSDMSVFHRVDDIMALTPRTLFQRAVRLPGYNGIIRRRIQAEAERENAAQEAMQRATGHRSAGGDKPQRVPDSVLVAQHAADGWGERVTK